MPLGETTWYALACYAVQVAIEAGATLQLRPEAIAAIPATDLPLPAPRPMNSRMTRLALDSPLSEVVTNSDDTTILKLLEESWERPVATYVQDLVLDKLI